jgi:hypothetical protein
MKPPHLAVLHTTSIPEEVFAEFRKLVAAENLDFQIESREEGVPFAGIEWLIPTAVIIYFGKSYFDGFLKEMGKDHYALLKAGLKTLHAKLLGTEAPKITVISTKGKSTSDQPYSLLYSILAEANGGLSFKLLLQREVTADEYEEIIASFLAFLQAYHGGNLDSGSVERMQQARVVGRTLLLAFNRDSKSIEPIDPLPSKKNHGSK